MECRPVRQTPHVRVGVIGFLLLTRLVISRKQSSHERINDDQPSRSHEGLTYKVQSEWGAAGGLDIRMPNADQSITAFCWACGHQLWEWNVCSCWSSRTCVRTAIYAVFAILRDWKNGRDSQINPN